MNKKHTKITQEERDGIAVLHARGMSGRNIAKVLKRHQSAINRELKRNRTNGGIYFSCKAHQLARHRKQQAGKRPRLKNFYVREYVNKLLRKFWSPEIIAGWLKRSKPEYYISHEAIYQYIYAEATNLIPLLIRAHPKRRKKGNGRRTKKTIIPNRISILERPATINNREEFGHWESDAISSKLNTHSINVLAERKSRYVKITPLSHNNAKLTARNIKLRLANLPPEARRSITYDNGPENVLHEEINDYLGTTSYFCQPYHSWEKGTVENINGLIRIHIPKKTNLAKLKEYQLANLEFWLNYRPKKCLGFKTPAEVFYELSGVLPP